MNKEEIQQTGWDIIYLVSCALHGKIPEEEKIKNMNLSMIYRMTERHMLTAIVAMGLEPYWGEAPVKCDSIWHPWEQAKVRAIRRNLLFDMERKWLLNFFEKNGIWYMPLKGSVLKDMYPQCGMRQMADIDILFDKTCRKKLYDFMTQNGYKAENYNKSNHDAYTKPPRYNFELHVDLFGARVDKRWIKYYEDVKERLLPDENKQYGYHFSDEDFYLYVTAHACKHFMRSGTGLRTLLDIYVYLWRKRDTLDWNYIAAELDKLGTAEFEKQCRLLAEKLFSENPVTDEAELTGEERELFYRCFYSGTYGTRDQYYNNRLREIQPDGQPLTIKTKLRYYMERLFMWPGFIKHKWQLPFYWIYRLARVAFTDGRRVANEIRAVWKKQ